MNTRSSMNQMFLSLGMCLYLTITSCGGHGPGVAGAAGTGQAAGFTDVRYARHLEKLKKKTPPGFTVVIQERFVLRLRFP